MMNNFTKLHPEMIHAHILPRLDGTNLTSLSSVSSEFRNMICNNNELWKITCTSIWPFLRHWNLGRVISTFPCGYRSFFSDAFPSLHHQNNYNSQSQCVDLPPTKDLISAIDMYLQGEPHPLVTSVRSQPTGSNFYFPTFHSDAQDFLEYNLFDLEIPEKTEGCKDYFLENFRLNWVVIDPTLKRAASLFHSSCKPVSVVQQTLTTTLLVYKKVMPGLRGISTERVRCYVEVTCSWRGKKWLWVEFGMEDMNGKRVSKKHANIILLNAIHNGKRKKFDL